MEIQLPKILDANKSIIRTSDGFKVDLKKGHNLKVLWQDDSKTVHNDSVDEVHILRSAHGPDLLVGCAIYVDVDYNGSATLRDLTGCYIFYHFHNLFKFGAQLGDSYWRSDLDKPWILPSAE